MRLCPKFSQKEVLDFETCEDRKNKSYSHASVDAITYTDNDKYFCFVEIKGWLTIEKRITSMRLANQAFFRKRWWTPRDVHQNK